MAMVMKHKVLVVDDSALIRKLLCDIFTSDEFQICNEAENGAQAIEKAKEDRPDLILLDFSMPVMTGLQAAPVLRKIVPDAPIIMFTLFGSAVSQQDLHTSGVTALFSKTDSLMSLRDKARSLLHTHPS